MDICQIGMGPALTKNGRLIAYINKQLAPRLRKASAYAWEMCTIIKVVREW